MLVEELCMSMVSSGVSEDPHFDRYFKYLFSRPANRAILWTCSDNRHSLQVPEMRSDT